jgi:hypothetical protein
MKEANTEPIEVNLEELFQFSLNIEEPSINPGKYYKGNTRNSKDVNTSGNTGAQITHPPWEMIHLPVGENALCAPPYTVYTTVCNKSLTSTSQYKISNSSKKVLVNNN